MNIYESAKQLARDLRKRQTRAEKLLWEQLRNRRFYGRKFFRQHVIFFDYYGRPAFFIADFSCREERLIIEIDGKSHDYQKEYDDYRTQIINSKELRVIRFKNEDVLKRMDMVLSELKKLMNI